MKSFLGLSFLMRVFVWIFSYQVPIQITTVESFHDDIIAFMVNAALSPL